MKNATLLACLTLSACASGPRTTTDREASGWLGVGAREAEVGVLAPVWAHVGAELSGGFRLDDGRAATAGRLQQAPDGLFGGGPGVPLEGGSPGEAPNLHPVARLGARMEVLPWLHAGGGVTECGTPYARIGVERKLTPCCTVGVEFLADRGEAAMLTIRWSR